MAPGTYGVRLTHGDFVMESAIEIQWDPINAYDEQKIRDQQRFLTDTFAMIDGIYKRVNSLLNIRKQVELRKSHYLGPA